MADFDPVEIRLDLIQNVDSEGAKSTAAMNDIAAASNKMKAQFEKDIAAQKALTTQLINELKLLKETMGKKVETGDDKQIIEKQKLAEQIELLNKKLIEQQVLLDRISKTPTTSSLPKLSNQVGDYARQVNGLKFSMTQISRELPNFAISPMIGIMSLSNNLPMLQGDITRMIELNKQLKASGQATTPVFKQLVSSLFSWQTALIAGISALMLWGPQIGSFISNLFKAKDALKLTKDEVNALNESFAKAAGADLGKLKTQFDALKNAKKGTVEYYDAKKQIIDQFGGLMKGMDSEIASLNNVKGAYQALTVEIIKTAKAKALQETTSSLATDFLTKSGKQYDIIQTNFIKKYGNDLGKMRFDMFKSQLESGQGFTYEMQRYIAEFNRTKHVAGDDFGQGAEIIQVNDINDAIEKYGKAKNEFDQKTKNAFDRFGNTSETGIKNTVAVIDERIQALKTEQKQVSENKAKRDEYQKQIDELEKNKTAITGTKTPDPKGDEEKNKRSMIETSKEYLDLQKQIIQKDKELTQSNLAGNTGLSLKLAQELNDLQNKLKALSESPTIQPIKAKLATTPVDTKTLGAMKQLTAEQLKQLEILSKAATLDGIKNDPEKLEEEAKLRQEIVGYALQLVDGLKQSLNLTEAQAAALDGAMNVVSALGQGDLIGAGIAGLTTLVTSALDTSGIEDKLAEPWIEFENWVSRSNDALERYIKLRDEAIGAERYSTSDEAIQKAQDIKTESELKLNEMKLSFKFVGEDSSSKDAAREIANQKAELEKKLGATLDYEDGKTLALPFYYKFQDYYTADLGDLTKDESGNFSLDKLRQLIADGTVADEAVIQAVKDYDANMDTLISLQKEKKELLTATMASGIADSIIEGFKNGYDSAADFADNFEGLMEDAVLNAVKIKALEEPLKKWYDQFSLDMESGGGLDENEKSILKAWWDDIVASGIAASDAALDAAGIDINTQSDRTGSTKGIAQASQDSVDELNGRMTAIQAYIYDIRNINQQSFDFEKESAAYDAAILSQLETIAENTDYCKYLENMDRVLSEIQLKGVKIKS